MISAPDEYGIPIQLGARLGRLLGTEDDLDVALSSLKNIDPASVTRDPFEVVLLTEAQSAIWGQLGARRGSWERPGEPVLLPAGPPVEASALARARIAAGRAREVVECPIGFEPTRVSWGASQPPRQLGKLWGGLGSSQVPRFRHSWNRDRRLSGAAVASIP